MESRIEKETELHLLLAEYIRMKVEAGYFPRNSILPKPQEFMAVFKLSFSTILKAIIELEREGVVLTLPEEGAKVLLGPPGTPRRLIMRKDIDELSELFTLLELELLGEAWPRIDALALNRRINAAKGMKPLERLRFAHESINEELIRACENMALVQAQTQTRRQLEFIRRMQMKGLPANKISDHSIEVESLLSLMCAGDFQGVRQRLLDYIATVRGEALGLFDDGAELLGRQAAGPGARKTEGN